jgi:hypothetical protein
VLIVRFAADNFEISYLSTSQSGVAGGSEFNPRCPLLEILGLQISKAYQNLTSFIGQIHDSEAAGKPYPSMPRLFIKVVLEAFVIGQLKLRSRNWEPTRALQKHHERRKIHQAITISIVPERSRSIRLDPASGILTQSNSQENAGMQLRGVGGCVENLGLPCMRDFQ